jgi:hypothetical protein
MYSGRMPDLTCGCSKWLRFPGFYLLLVAGDAAPDFFQARQPYFFLFSFF